MEKIYIIKLGSKKALHECKAVEIKNNEYEILNWIEGNFESDMDYYNYNMEWKWVEVIYNSIYACIIKSNDFDKPTFDGEMTFKESIEWNLDIVSDLVYKL